MPVRPSLRDKGKLGRKEAVISPKEVRAPVFEGVGGSQHPYLQTLIKKTGEEKGYRQ